MEISQQINQNFEDILCQKENDFFKALDSSVILIAGHESILFSLCLTLEKKLHFFLKEFEKIKGKFVHSDTTKQYAISSYLWFRKKAEKSQIIDSYTSGNFYCI